MLVHCSLDINGALKRPQDWVNCITVDGKTLKTVEEVKNFFQEQLKLGRKVLPMGGCDNFDYEHGCKGHKEMVGDANIATTTEMMGEDK